MTGKQDGQPEETEQDSYIEIRDLLIKLSKWAPSKFKVMCDYPVAFIPLWGKGTSDQDESSETSE